MCNSAQNTLRYIRLKSRTLLTLTYQNSRSMSKVVREILCTGSILQGKLLKDHVIALLCLTGQNICLVTYIFTNSLTFDLFDLEIELRCKKTKVRQGHELSSLKSSRHSAKQILRYRPNKKSTVRGCRGQGHQSRSQDISICTAYRTCQYVCKV